MKLTAKKVEQLAHLRALIKRAEKAEKDLTDSFRDEMQLRKIDIFAPKGCPFQIELSEYEKSDVSWKTLAKKFSKRLYGVQWKKFLLKEVKSFGRSPVAAVLVQPNAENDL